jgi:hypothetical protein
MKKVMVGIIGTLLLCSLAIAANGQNSGSNSIPANNGMSLEEYQQLRQIRSGDYQINGSRLTIQRKLNNRIQLKAKNVSVDCDCNLTEEFDPVQNRSKLKVKLNNGRNAEVKIMPNTASETALKRLRLKNCNEARNCTIELKEVGEGNQTRLAYEARTEKTFRLFGIFKNREKVSVQIDAETGEEINSRRPWWAWMASEDDGREED